jgi:uncharacterized integral membrane protein
VIHLESEQFFDLVGGVESSIFYRMRNLKLIIAAVLAILVAIMVVQNREPVETHVLFATVVMPHAILLFISAAVGFALGVLLTLSLKPKRKDTQ